MKILFLGLALLTLITPSFAALPPLYQSLGEFKSVIENKELISKLESGEAILSISRIDKGFVVKTNKSSIEVDVAYDPAGQPGPAKYHLIVKDRKPNL